MLVLFRFHDDRIENRYYGCMPRIARFTEVAGYKSGFWSKDPIIGFFHQVFLGWRYLFLFDG